VLIILIDNMFYLHVALFRVQKVEHFVSKCKCVCVSSQLGGIFGKQTWNLSESVSFNHTKT